MYDLYIAKNSNIYIRDVYNVYDISSFLYLCKWDCCVVVAVTILRTGMSSSRKSIILANNYILLPYW